MIAGDGVLAHREVVAASVDRMLEELLFGRAAFAGLLKPVDRKEDRHRDRGNGTPPDDAADPIRLEYVVGISRPQGGWDSIQPPVAYSHLPGPYPMVTQCS